MPPSSRQDLPRRPPVPRGDLSALREEFQRVGVGPLLLGEVRSTAYGLVARYNAAIYSEIGNWRHGFEDLVQDVVTDSLLRDHQAHYMLETAATIDDFRRLLARQVRRRLARRRTRTVVDNILGRARPLLAVAPFEGRLRHEQVTYCLAGSNVEGRAATFRELRTAAQALRSVPHGRRSNGERAPMVYTTPDLRLALSRLAEALPVAFTIGELDRALRLALPHFLPGVLDPDERGDGHYDEVDDARVSSCARALLERLDSPLRFVLAMKLAGSSDAEVGEVLGVSRRTATNRKAAAYAVTEELLHPLPHPERLLVLDHLAPAMHNALVQSRSSTP